MKLTEKDFEGTALLARILKELEYSEPSYIESRFEEMHIQQPVMLSHLLSYHGQVPTQAIVEITKIYLLIWEFLKLTQQIPSTEISPQLFDQTERWYVAMMKYAESESHITQSDIFESNLLAIKSKALLAAVLLRLDTRVHLIQLSKSKKNILFLGITTLITCFETLLGKENSNVNGLEPI